MNVGFFSARRASVEEAGGLGPRFCEGSGSAEKGHSVRPPGSPVPLHAWKHHKKRRSVHTLSLNIKRRIIVAEKEAVQKRDSRSIEGVRW